MNEKIPTMEGGRMGREGNTIWGWLGKLHWSGRLHPSIQGFELPSVPGKALPAPGWIHRTKSKDSAWLVATLGVEQLHLPATA